MAVPEASPRVVGFLQLARLLLNRTLQLGAQATPEEADENTPGLGSITSVRGAKLQTRRWDAPSAPRALVVFCHGFGTQSTHNQAWNRVAELHVSHGLACAGIDYMGHGYSEGRRSRLESVECVVDDLLQFIDEVLRPAFPAPLPIFLRGQSLGGIVALAAALRRPKLFSGLALGAPAFELRWYTYPFAPRAITSGAADVRAKLSRLALPVACFQGVEDTTVDPVGARHLIGALEGCQTRSLYLYVDMGHNMSIEPDVSEFLLARLDELHEGRAAAAVADGGPCGAVLKVRRPAAGVVWRQPPPGSKDANVGTVVEVVEPAKQAEVLDELLKEECGVPL